jgi:hypothetical protein
MADDLHATDVSQHSPWGRLLYLVLFALILNITQGIVFITALVQFIFHLFTNRHNARLAGFGASAGLYMAEVATFLTYQTNRLPFPFTDWPKVGESKAE